MYAHHGQAVSPLNPEPRISELAMTCPEPVVEGESGVWAAPSVGLMEKPLVSKRSQEVSGFFGGNTGDRPRAQRKIRKPAFLHGAIGIERICQQGFERMPQALPPGDSEQVRQKTSTRSPGLCETRPRHISWRGCLRIWERFRPWSAHIYTENPSGRVEASGQRSHSLSRLLSAALAKSD